MPTGPTVPLKITDAPPGAKSPVVEIGASNSMVPAPARTSSSGVPFAATTGTPLTMLPSKVIVPPPWNVPVVGSVLALLSTVTAPRSVTTPP